jgi:hypothetical protein
LVGGRGGGIKGDKDYEIKEIINVWEEVVYHIVVMCLRDSRRSYVNTR